MNKVISFSLISVILVLITGLSVVMASDLSTPTLYRIHVQVQGQGIIQVTPKPTTGANTFSGGTDTYVYYDQAGSLTWRSEEHTSELQSH